jgi:hypothetical protein
MGKDYEPSELSQGYDYSNQSHALVQTMNISVRFVVNVQKVRQGEFTRSYWLLESHT